MIDAIATLALELARSGAWVPPAAILAAAVLVAAHDKLTGDAVTVDEYMDPKRFPKTTQAGLTVREQILKDSVNHDDVRDDREAGTLDPAHAATVAELDEKAKVWDQVAADAKAAGRL